MVALGKTWGVTPLDLRLRDAFPALYRPEQPYIGMAVYLRKAGCQEHRTPIHRRSIPAEIRVTLDCAADETQAKPSATPAPIPRETAAPTKAPAVSPASPAGTTAVEEAMPPASVRKKLEELQELRKSGLISEQEYQQLRSRVLDYF